MTDYRVYVLGDDGHIVRAIELDCQDDSAATEAAKQHLNGRDIELWQRERCVARFGALRRPE